MLVQKFVFELALANNDASSFHICHIDYGLRTGDIITCDKSRLCRVCLDLATARNGRQMAQRITQSSAAASAWCVEKCTVTAAEVQYWRLRSFLRGRFIWHKVTTSINKTGKTRNHVHCFQVQSLLRGVWLLQHWCALNQTAYTVAKIVNIRQQMRKVILSIATASSTQSC